MTARWRDVLYPWALLRELVAGPGLHRVLAPGVFVDGDAFLRFGRQLDQPALVMPPAELELASARDSTGLDLEASVIADRRDDRVEPTRGWLLGAGASYSPGGAVGDHRWLQLTGDARAFVPVGDAWSIALRASGGWVGLGGDAGIPLGPRLFGGGAYGMRGFGRDQLSPAVGAVLVGGRSLVESTAELRWLPFRKQVGAAAFVDAGQAGAGANPFADGISVAAGAGFRLRLWYLPIALDLAYRVIDSNHADLAWNRVLAFVRVGEAF
jgi:outer membrane protein assembly factor BamA